MLKKYIYLSIIAIMTFSCSDLSSEIVGEWTLQKESAYSNAKLLISEKDADILGSHRVKEIERESVEALIGDLTYSFQDDGGLSTTYSSKQDNWTKSGEWSIESDILEVSLEGYTRKYSIEIDENAMNLKDLSTGEIFNFNRKKN